MISQEELDFIAMVLTLPWSENPFVASATQLEKLCKDVSTMSASALHESEVKHLQAVPINTAGTHSHRHALYNGGCIFSVLPSCSLGPECFIPIRIIGTNTSFLLSIIAIFVWGMEKVNRDMKEIIQVCKAVVNTLGSTASTYNSTTYSPVKLLNILSPAKALASLRNDIGVHSRIVLTTGLIDLCLLTTLYVPLVGLTFRDIRRRTKQLFHTSPKTDSPEAADLAHKIHNRLKQEHVSLVAHAFAAYFSTMMYIPLLAWALSFSALNFVENKVWLSGMQIGMHGPFAISGNV
ncbi:hypothetical protein DFH28DRAFT_881426 [Melampsora americana]|nr:hypothetical protein DFH28DRAFT_881426 [Melampsora americana]